MSNRRFALILAVLILLLSGAIFLTTLVKSGQQGRDELMINRSVYNAKPSGYKAWYQTLQNAGVQTRIWRTPFSSLNKLPAPATMVIIEPYTYNDMTVTFGPKDIKSLLAWVEEGNTLVLLDTFQRKNIRKLLVPLRIPPPSAIPVNKAASWKTAKAYPLVIGKAEPLLKSFITRNVETTMPYRLSVDPTPDFFLPNLQEPDSETTESQDGEGETENEPDAAAEAEATEEEPIIENGADAEDPGDIEDPALDLPRPTPRKVLLSDENGEPLLFKVRYGKGNVLIGTPTDLASNQYLFETEVDNYQFLSNMLLLEGNPIVINEYIHGFSENPDILSYYSKTPLGKIFMQVFFLVIVLLWLSFYRWKPVRQTRQEEAAPAQTDFIQSIAGIYYRSQSSLLALAPLIGSIETILRQRYRVELNEANRIQTLLQSLFGDYSNREDRMRHLQRAQEIIRQDQKIPHRDLLKLVRELSLIKEKLVQTDTSPETAQTLQTTKSS